MKWMKAIVPFAFGVGLIVCGPVLTMIMFPEKLEVSYAYGVTDALLVVSGILYLSAGLQIISKGHDEDG